MLLHKFKIECFKCLGSLINDICCYDAVYYVLVIWSVAVGIVCLGL